MGSIRGFTMGRLGGPLFSLVVLACTTRRRLCLFSGFSVNVLEISTDWFDSVLMTGINGAAQCEVIPLRMTLQHLVLNAGYDDARILFQKVRFLNEDYIKIF